MATFPTPVNPLLPANSFVTFPGPTNAGQPLPYPAQPMVMRPEVFQSGYAPGVNFVPPGSVTMPGMMINPLPQGMPVPMSSPSVHLQSNVSEQQVVIPQPPQSQIVQEIRRIPMQIPGPPQRHVVRSFTQRVVTIPQPPEIRVINETIKRPVVIPQPPQIQIVYDKVPRSIMVPVPPEIRMQRSEVVEGPFISRPPMPVPNFAPQPIIAPMVPNPLPIPFASESRIQPPMIAEPMPVSTNVVINSYSPTAVLPQGEIPISNPIETAVPNQPLPVVPLANFPNVIVDNPPAILPPESGFFKQSESVPQPSILVDNRPPL